MARVYRAVLHGPAGFRKPVALKVLRTLKGERVLENIDDLMREARLGGLLRHPNIVDVYELSQHSGGHFIAMELIDGLSIRQLIDAGHFPPAGALFEIGVGIAAGLEKAHAVRSGGRPSGLVHCDLKPSNVLMSWDGAVKIADFGVAFTLASFDNSQRDPTIQGTPSFMAPEQALGELVDGRTDLFSLGLVLTELATGKRLFKKMGLVGMNPHDYACFDGSFLTPDLREIVDSKVEGLGAILKQCLAANPDNRPQNASSLMVAMESLNLENPSNLSLRQWARKLKNETWKGGGLGTVDLLAPTLIGQGPTGKVEGYEQTPQEAGTNIGPSMDAFVGREDEINTLLQLTNSGSRLITLKGLGGTGKTRLSRKFAQHRLTTYAGGAWFVDLTEARSAEAMLHAVGSTLDVPIMNDSQLENSITQLGRAMSGRGMTMVVLDNFEQVTKAGAPIVARWLELAPNVVFLVTSREPLHIAGETIVDLQPLSEEHGVRLLKTRAESAGAKWADSKENQTAILDLVRRLDGIPLAIEMAAARAVQLGPVPLLKRVSTHISKLSNVRRDQHARQGTLGALLDWSWQLLEPWEQAAFAQLSVFKRGFNMEAAEAVLDLSPWPDAPWVMDVIGSLIDKSLIRSWSLPGETRFGMYWTVQEYTSGQLEETDSLRSTRLRHAAYFAAYGTLDAVLAFRSHGGFGQVTALTDELENLIAGVHAGVEFDEGDLAAQCAIATEIVHARSGFPATILRILKQANNAEGMSDLNRGRLICRIADLVRRDVGDQAEIKHWLTRADEIAERTGHSYLKARANIIQALNSAWQGDGAIALQWLMTAQEHARAAGSQHLESLALRSLSTVSRGAGKVPEAIEYLEMAREIAKANGDDLASVQLHSVSGGLYRLMGNADDAQACYLVALTISRQLKLRSIEGVVMGNLANLYTQTGQLDMAQSRYEKAMEIASEVGNSRSEAICTGNLGALLLKKGELDKGARLLTRAIETQDHLHPVSAGSFRGVLAMIRAKQGDIDEARGLLDHGEKQVRGASQEELGLLLCSRGEVEHIAGETMRVEQALKEAEAICVLLKVRPESQLGQATEQLRRTQT